MSWSLLNDFAVVEHIKSALKEDIGFGDISTNSVASDDDFMEACLNSREDGVLCGVDVFKAVFELLDDRVEVEKYFQDGDKIKKGDKIAVVKGSAKTILTGERTALNYVQRMSGISSETAKYQAAIAPYHAKITDTRKTTPNFRIFEKYAVKTGGGALHRFNLSDCVMLKDNHIKLVGSISAAVSKVRENISHAHKIEVECDTLAQVQEALLCGVDIIMLDNMSVDDMKKAVKLIENKAIVEASGTVNLSSVNEIASTGVDIISSSAIVAKANPLDLGLDS